MQPIAEGNRELKSPSAAEDDRRRHPSTAEANQHRDTPPRRQSAEAKEPRNHAHETWFGRALLRPSADATNALESPSAEAIERNSNHALAEGDPAQETPSAEAIES